MKLGRTEREILWTLSSFENTMDIRNLRFYIGRHIKGSIRRLANKKLIEKNGKKVKLTADGETVIRKIAEKGEIWKERKIRLKTKIKLAAFDLDDTLVPGYVSKTFDVEIMRQFLKILKDNDIRTTVLSINPKDVVYWKLRQFGLLQYIDYPFQTTKGEGLLRLLKMLNLREDEAIFIGHDLMFDYQMVRSRNPNVKIILLKDCLSNTDKSVKLNDVINDNNLVIVERRLKDLINIINFHGGNAKSFIYNAINKHNDGGKTNGEKTQDIWASEKVSGDVNVDA
jgi:predicted HAD superfamily phosphohydrolase YqeG